MSINNKIFKHFRGGEYRALYMARDSNNASQVVVYQSLTTGDIWVRSAEEFFGDHESGVKRFVKQA